MKHITSIQTENLNITASVCQALDRAVFSSTPAPDHIVQKHAVYVAELKAKIASLRPDFKTVNNNSAYNLYSWCERFIIEDGNHISERMHANGESARTQLKAWH